MADREKTSTQRPARRMARIVGLKEDVVDGVSKSTRLGDILSRLKAQTADLMSHMQRADELSVRQIGIGPEAQTGVDAATDGPTSSGFVHQIVAEIQTHQRIIDCIGCHLDRLETV